MKSASQTTVGGIVLCGGRSSRMGRPKFALPFGPEVMLQRVVRILSDVVQPIVVVAAPNQQLPWLPASVRIVRDEREYLGPLAGIAAGLTALAADVDAAYVSSCDAPLLKSALVRSVVAALGTNDIAIPRDDRFYHPLAAVYRTRLAKTARGLVAADRLRAVDLLEGCRTREVDVEVLRAVDTDLASLQNVNTPEDYRSALHQAGFGDD